MVNKRNKDITSSKTCSFFYMIPHLYPGSPKTRLCPFGDRESFTWMIIIKDLFSVWSWTSRVGKRWFLLLHLDKIDAKWQNVSIFATATAQNSHKNFHQFYLPKNLCHGGTQKEVEQVSELHTCKVWRYDQCISGVHSFKHINLQDLQLEFNLWIEPQQNPALDVYHLPQIRCLLMVSSDKFSCNGPGKVVIRSAKSHDFLMLATLVSDLEGFIHDDGGSSSGHGHITRHLNFAARLWIFEAKKSDSKINSVHTTLLQLHLQVCDNKSNLPFCCESLPSWSSNNCALRTWRFARFLAQW